MQIVKVNLLSNNSINLRLVRLQMKSLSNTLLVRLLRKLLFNLNKLLVNLLLETSQVSRRRRPTSKLGQTLHLVICILKFLAKSIELLFNEVVLPLAAKMRTFRASDVLLEIL